MAYEGGGTGTPVEAGDLWATEGEADDYFLTRLNSSAWTGATSGDKTAALTTAQNDIALNPQLTGLPSTATDTMKLALYEQAIYLLESMVGASKRGAVRAGGVKQAAVVGETYIDGAPMLPLAPRAQAFLTGYLESRAFYNDVVEIVRDEDDA